MARLVVLIGTGTSVGKTYLAERMLRAFARDGRSAVGFKPVESGVSGDAESDIARLDRASTFHVKPPLASQTFAAPVAPHLAARKEGRRVDVAAIRREVQRGAASGAEVLLVELPGGAFSPVADGVSGADLVRAFPGATVLLVAPDRLGVLHDVTATTLACAARGLPLAGIVLNAAGPHDPSTGTNAVELLGLVRAPLLARIPHSPVGAPLDEDDPTVRLVRSLLQPQRPQPRG
jgi:dethiobiotin synthetase